MTDLDAILDRLIPGDGAPGARELVDVERVRAAVPGLDGLVAGLPGFKVRAPAEQDEILADLDRSGDAVFVRLVAVVHELYYAHPRSWPALGYTTNVPGRP